MGLDFFGSHFSRFGFLSFSPISFFFSPFFSQPFFSSLTTTLVKEASFLDFFKTFDFGTVFARFVFLTQEKIFFTEFFLFQLPPPFLKFCFNYRLLFFLTKKKSKIKMCDSDLESKVNQTTSMSLKLGLQHQGNVQTMSRTLQTCLQDISFSFI